MWIIRLVLFSLIIVSLSVFAKNQVVHLEPAVVELQGSIKVLTFPGAPNYESIEKGDAKETGFYLILDKPIDVISNTTGNKNIKMLQLVIQTNDMKIKSGDYVLIEGTLFNAETGHHHTKVLLQVRKIKPL